MKLVNKSWLVVFIVGFFGLACNDGSSTGGGGSDLSDDLSNKTFELTTSCSSSGNDSSAGGSTSPSPSTSPAQEEPENNNDNGVSALYALRSVSSNRPSIAFSGNGFTIRQYGLTVLSGTWRTLDESRIRLIANGDSLDARVRISGDRLTLSLPENPTFNCTGRPESGQEAGSANDGDGGSSNSTDDAGSGESE